MLLKTCSTMPSGHKENILYSSLIAVYLCNAHKQNLGSILPLLLFNLSLILGLFGEHYKFKTNFHISGIYVSRNTYIRAGIAEWKVTNPVHLVCFCSIYLIYVIFFYNSFKGLSLYEVQIGSCVTCTRYQESQKLTFDVLLQISLLLLKRSLNLRYDCCNGDSFVLELFHISVLLINKSHYLSILHSF